MSTRCRTDSAVNLRRAYFDSRYGQLHVRTAFPNTGGFDERTPLVLLHSSPATSRAFVPLLPELGTDRSLYAADTPGCGESDAPGDAPTIADYAAAIGDLLDGLRLRQVDLLGCHTGSAIAAEVAIARPAQVRRVAFVGLPLYTAGERETFPRQPRPESVASGAPAWWAARATAQWRGDERLGLVKQPVLVMRPKDELWEHTARGRALLRHALWHDRPELGVEPFGAAPQALAAELRRFYDAA